MATVKGKEYIAVYSVSEKHAQSTFSFMQLTWHAKKCPLILTITWSFSSGVWSRGTTTSAQVKFCSSFTCTHTDQN